MELTPEQVRVLGCLVEKEKATPETYPLSTNALVLACNQRTSRDPVVSYDEHTATAAMVALRERGLARTLRGEGNRVFKHAHRLDEALGLGGGELAVLSVLMLRGPQTVGELRTRTERQHPFASLQEVEDVLAALARRDPPLVRQLPRAPGQKEARWQQLLGAEPGPAAGGAVAAPAEAPAPPAGSTVEAELAALREELAALRARLDALEARFG